MPGHGTVPDVQQVPRHSEVNQESTTGSEPNNQILAATIDGGDPFTPELRGHLGRVERAREARVEDRDALEAAAKEQGLEPTANSLDLW